ncbi:MAG: DUF624 domain-containing protein [Clostridia bacterium]|nr:DUF624 domain-containing protein [Clostridia bacterium]
MKKPILSIDYTKPGKGVKKGSSKLFTFQNFFPLLKRKIWGLIKVNLLWLVTNLPLLVGFFALAGWFDHSFSTPSDPLWAILSGVETLSGQSPELAALMGTAGVQMTMSRYGTVTLILFGVAALSIFTFGLANTGMAYILRGYTKEEYVDMPDDFFIAIKKNFGQALLVGVLDILIVVMIMFASVFYLTNYQYSFFFSIGIFICLILGVLYTMSRFYLYPILVTFKLPVRKIFKNAFIFSIIGFKRNLAGLFGALAVIVINLLLYWFIMPIGGLFPFFITFALTSFITTYAAWPNIKRVMIDPYYTDKKPVDDGDDDPVFVDRG